MCYTVISGKHNGITHVKYIIVIEGICKGREEEEEDVRSYWVTLKGREGTGN